MDTKKKNINCNQQSWRSKSVVPLSLCGIERERSLFSDQNSPHPVEGVCNGSEEGENYVFVATDCSRSLGNWPKPCKHIFQAVPLVLAVYLPLLNVVVAGPSQLQGSGGHGAVWLSLVQLQDHSICYNKARSSALENLYQHKAKVSSNNFIKPCLCWECLVHLNIFHRTCRFPWITPAQSSNSLRLINTKVRKLIPCLVQSPSCES